MKKLFSILLFLGFLFFCGLEVAPKFYHIAARGSDKVLFVAGTKQSGPTKQSKQPKKDTEIDYQKLIQGINPKGA